MEVTIDGVKYILEETPFGYLVTTDNNTFIIYKEKGWKSADDISPSLVYKIGKAIDGEIRT